MYNRLENNYHLTNKKALFLNLRQYYEVLGQDYSDVLPRTFHIKALDDQEYKKFSEFYYERANLQKQSENQTSHTISNNIGSNNASNIWIIKPGENSNRGYGIEVRKDFGEI